MLFHGTSSIAQTTPHIDSLLKVLPTMKEDTNKANLLHELSRGYLYELHKMDKVNEYAQLELELSQKLNFKKGIAFGLLNKGIFFWSTGDYKTALYHYKKSLRIMLDIGNKKGSSSCYLNIGQIYVEQGDYREAEKYMLNGIKGKEEIADKRGLSSGYNNIGNLYQYQGEYAKALKNHLKALKIREEMKDKVGIAMSYNNIGLVLVSQDKPDEALKYYKNGVKIQEELDDKLGLGNIYNNIGNIYGGRNEHKEALLYHLKSLKVREAVNDKQGMALSYNNIGNSYLELKNVRAAISYQLKGLAMCLQIGDKKGMVNSYNGVGNLYIEQGKFDQGLSYYDTALVIARELNFKEGILQLYGNYANAYEKSKQFKKAIAYTKMLHVLRDSLLNKENFKQVTELNTKYETDKKEKEILLLTKDQILTEKVLKEQRLIGWGLVGGLGLLFVSVFSIYRRYRFKQKANLLLEKQKKEIEQKNTLITDSIDYAKNIQELVLPDQNKVHELFPESFILYKPKSTVSGDFYWMRKIGSKLICAVTDCTGHGVPGAFMSLLGFNMLENMVKKNKITQPSKILDALNKEVVSRLGRSSESINDIKHGMDIALISIDTDTHQLQYSGAHNPIYIIRDGALLEIKANKRTIGFDNKDNSILYTNQTQELRKGDMIYLFTDGFPDQIGGPQRKKFFYPPFRELLRSLSSFSLETQCQKLEEAHIKWLDGRFEQTDDILVMGIRY
jgi:serine phosphatase RsbU (regulator of sigma subunit)